LTLFFPRSFFRLSFFFFAVGLTLFFGVQGRPETVAADATLYEMTACEDDHAVAFGGMCASCGCELSDDFMQHALASVKHGHRSVTVSRQEAARIDGEVASSLLEHRKLALVLDLDHTLIHTTSTNMLKGSHDGKFDGIAERFAARAAEPFAQSGADASGDPDESKSEDAADAVGPEAALEQLVDQCDDVFLIACPPDPAQYVVKLRPGVRQMLQRLSPRFDMYVYTMGTRDYAERIVQLLDPNETLLSTRRIVSRDDGLGQNEARKSLSALFPFNDSMAVIIDDRDDVWMESNSQSGREQVCGNLLEIVPYHYFRTTGEVNALPGDPTGGTEAEAEETSTGDGPLDEDLEVMERLLDQIHDRFYGSVSEGDGDPEKHANTKEIIRYLRTRVLYGCKLAFSHVIPREQKAEASSIWRSVRRFGGTCSLEFSRSRPEATHLVAANAATQKVVDAKHARGVYLVHRQWLDSSMRRWERLAEADFPLSSGGDDDPRLPTLRPGSNPPDLPVLTWRDHVAQLEIERLQREQAERTQRERERLEERSGTAGPRATDELDSLFDSADSDEEEGSGLKRTAFDAFGEDGIPSERRRRLEEDEEEDSTELTYGKLFDELSDDESDDDE
jgi:RNA polymerase II subunit A C-terminal domain phosphatase